MKLHFYNPGDRNVGIFPANGTITIESNIVIDQENVEEIKKFFGDLLEVTVVTQEEYEQDLAKENTYLCTVCHSTPVNVDDGYDTCPDCIGKL